MSDLLLTDDEAKRFAEYCRRIAVTGEGLIKQMEKINAPESLIKLEGKKVYAYHLVAEDIESAERMAL